MGHNWNHSARPEDKSKRAESKWEDTEKKSGEEKGKQPTRGIKDQIRHNLASSSLKKDDGGSEKRNQSEVPEVGPKKEYKAVSKSTEKRGGLKNRSQSGRKGIRKKACREPKSQEDGQT